jgi:diguanylate cyclase
MALLDLTQEQARTALNGLRDALYHHEMWYEALNRTLACRQIPDERDLHEEAHYKCQFGQWLYGKGAERLRLHPRYSQLVTAHELMHRYARRILATCSEHGSVSPDDYELFLSALRQMRSEIAATKHELEDLTCNIDPLTGAGNRNAMFATLREKQSLVQRKAQFACIAMMDLDHFSEINKAYGSKVGDEILVQFAAHVMSHMRPYDDFFRCGGEEFLYCAVDTDIERARIVVERLREGLAQKELKFAGYVPLSVTVSFGLTPLDPEVPVEKSIERADAALRSAKAAGRNRTVVWDASMK